MIAPRQLIASSRYLRTVEENLPKLADKSVLIVWGMKDFAFRDTERKRFERAFPRHKTVMLANASHFLQEDAGERIAEETKVFLSETDRQATEQDFVLGGNNDKLIIRGECGSVSVTGSNNLVTLDKVRQINVVGSNNAFTYRESAGGATPQFASIGTNNTVQKTESERPSSGPGKLESTSPEAAKAGGTLVIEGSGGQNRSETVSDADVVVNSGGNHLTFSGSVKTLTVNGGGNQIALEKLESITFNGSGNSVAYSVEKSGGKAKVTDNGHGNSVSDTE